MARRGESVLAATLATFAALSLVNAGSKPVVVVNTDTVDVLSACHNETVGDNQP